MDILTSCGAFSPCMGILTLCGTFSPCVGILNLHGHCHLMWTFLPCMGILILHGHSHLAWDIFTLHEHIHLVWSFLPCVDILTSHRAFLLCVGHFHLALGIPTSHAPHIYTLLHHHHHISHLMYSLPQQQTSHLISSPTCDLNILYLTWKNSQNSDEAIPIPSIYKVPLCATNNKQ